MKEEKDIEQLFRSSFEEFEVTPPPAVRDAIARRLASPWYRRPWFLLGIAAAVIAGAVVIFLSGHSSDTPGIQQPLAGNETGSVPSENEQNSNSRVALPDEASDQTSKNEGENHENAATGDNPGRSKAGEKETNPAKHSGQDVQPINKYSGSSGQKSAKRQPASATGDASALPNNSAKSKKNDGSQSPGRDPGRKEKARIGEIRKKNKEGLAELGRIESELKKHGITTGIDSRGLSEDAGKSPEELAEEIRLKTEELLAELAEAKNNERNAELANVQKARQDSIAQVEYINLIKAKQDSIAKANDAAKKEEPKADAPPPAATASEKKAGVYNWQASLYGGILPVKNAGTADGAVAVESMATRYISAELQRVLPGKWVASTGFSYAARRETFTRNFSETTAYYVGMDSIPIMQGDTIVGYDYVENYDTTVTTWMTNHSKLTQSFGIPLFMGHSFAFNSNWGANVQLGAIIQFYKVTSTGDAETVVPTYSKTGVHGFVRLNATYNWKQFVFSAGVNSGYDFKPSVVYSDFQRKVYYIGPQVGIHYRF